MPTKKQIQPGQKVPLKLTVTERKLILEDLMCLDQDYEQIVRGTPTGKPVLMKHERHEEFMDWNESFDPDDFDPKKATREMKKGLPDWRSM